MRTRTWTGWIACMATAMLLGACGGGGGSSGAGATAPAGTGGDAGGSAGGNGGSGSTAVAKSYTLVMNRTSGQVGVGSTLSLTASVVDDLGNDVTGATTFVWTSGNGSVAAVANGTIPGSAVVTGVGVGTTAVNVAATVAGANGTTTVLPQVAATITVVAPGARTYSLALPYPVLSMTNGQVLPVTASLIDSDGADRSGAATGWTWRSSTTAVQATGSTNVGTLRGVNTSDTTAQSVVTVQVTAPDGNTLTGAFLVSVFKTSVSTYRLVLSQYGKQINALNVLNGYPQTYDSRVLRNDESDATADFTGLWTYMTTSPSLAVVPNASTRVTTVSTSRPTGIAPLQSVLEEMAGSLTLTAKPRAQLLVTEQPTWGLIYSGPSPFIVPNGGAPVSAHLLHRGIDEGVTGCNGTWNWQVGSGPVSIVPHGGNLASVVPSGSGPFTVIVSCTAGTEAMPVSLTIPGVAQ
ncbi:membrane-anchored cell surface protein [Cupriavidus sp. U2]|nr:membrane-anchored cell surface protein [Cupriavidus sp. U2]